MTSALPWRSPLHASVATATVLLLAIGLVALTRSGERSDLRLAGFDAGWTWTTSTQLLPAGTDEPEGARLVAHADGALTALAIADGDDLGAPGEAVLVARNRSAAGQWQPVDVVPLGAGDAYGRSLNAFADAAGRVLVVWAERGAIAGQWPIRSVSRALDGTWGPPEQVYLARTNGALGVLNQLTAVRPRLVPSGDTATLAWATVTGAPSSRIDVEEEPFRARRWTAGAWGPELASDGYGAVGLSQAPSDPDWARVEAAPRFAVRPSDGRISVVYDLEKFRPTHSIPHPLNPGASGPNVDWVWDGVPERPWESWSRRTLVVHLDPDDADWGAPQPLAYNSGPVNCASPDLPANPPFVEFWQSWRTASVDDGISSSCLGYETHVEFAGYEESGALVVGLDYRSDPTAVVRDLQFGDKACDDPSGGNSGRFCFDEWDGTDWGVEWPDARVAIAPGSDAPAEGAVTEGPWQASTAITRATDSGSVTVQPPTTSSDRFLAIDRSFAPDVSWSPAPDTTGTLTVSDVFVSDDDVAIFYDDLVSGSVARCGMLLLRAGETTPGAPLDTCVSGSTQDQRDYVQLPNGTLAAIDAGASGTPVRIYGPAGGPTSSTPTPTTASPTTVPPTPTTFTMIKAPRVTGVVKVGKKVTASPGQWSPTPTSVSYRWYLGSKAVKGATKRTLKLTRAMKGKKLSMRVTVRRSGVKPTVRSVVVGRVR